MLQPNPSLSESWTPLNLQFRADACAGLYFTRPAVLKTAHMFVTRRFRAPCPHETPCRLPATSCPSCRYCPNTECSVTVLTEWTGLTVSPHVSGKAGVSCTARSCGTSSSARLVHFLSCIHHACSAADNGHEQTPSLTKRGLTASGTPLRCVLSERLRIAAGNHHG